MHVYIRPHTYTHIHTYTHTYIYTIFTFQYFSLFLLAVYYFEVFVFLFIFDIRSKSSYAVYYIDFTLLLVLIRSFKKEICLFVRRSIIFSIVMPHSEIPIFLSIGNLSLLWSWSYWSWIYSYLCNQYLSPLKLCVWIPLMEKCTRYNIMWSSLSVSYDRSVVYSAYSSFSHLKLTATI